MIKKIVLGLIILILLVGAAGYYLFLDLDHMIKEAVEKYGSEATQAKVTLDSVDLTLSTGSGILKGLNIANPKGFAASKALHLGSISVQIDSHTIRGAGPIVIRNVTIDQPQITYELLNDGSSNLQSIEKNIETYAHSFHSDPPSKKVTPESENVAAAPGQSGRKIIIDDLTVHNGQVTITQALLQGRALSTGLPDIHLTDIGKSRGGATAAEVARQVLNAIINEASQASVATLAKEKLNGLLKNVPASAIGGAAVDTAGSKLKSLFGN